MFCIKTYLKSCRELACFCSQDGWIDNESLHFNIMQESATEIILEVEFNEVTIEASGQPAGKISCCGQLHLYLDTNGRVINAIAL